MPRGGDVMVYKKDTTLGQTKEFDAQIQVLDIPNEIKVGYSPIGFVRCGRAACRISALKWEMAKRQVARSWRTLTPSSPTRWLSAPSSLSSLWLQTPSRTARVCPVSPSWMAMVL